eukprot:EST48187.1 Hypothetical protein SS50377_11625 [Spironucleus salmonicida]
MFSFSSGELLIYDRSMNASTLLNCNSPILSLHQIEKPYSCYICTFAGVIQVEPRTGKFIQISKKLYSYYSENLKIQPIVYNEEQQYHLTRDNAYTLYQVTYDDEVIQVPCGGLGVSIQKDVALVSQQDGVCLQKQKLLTEFAVQNSTPLKEFLVYNNSFAVTFVDGQCQFGKFGEKSDITVDNIYVNCGFYHNKLYLATNSGMYVDQHLLFDDGTKVQQVNGDDKQIFFVSGGQDEIGIFCMKV